MAPRLQLQTILETILGSRNVYFQPPPSTKMNYPAIVYSRDDVNTIRANNEAYNQTKRYSVTVIDSDPDSKIHEAVGKLPLTAYDRFYAADQLNHDVYKIFF